MRVRIERRSWADWSLSISGGSDRLITRRSLIRKTIMMVVLDIATIMLITAVIAREIQAGDNALLMMLTAFPVVAGSVGQFHWWRTIGQSLREHGENESE